MQTVDQAAHSSSKLHHLRGTRPLFEEELRARIADGARLVRFEFCFSLVFFTMRRQSPVYLTDSWQQRYLLGLQYSFLALVLGLWGVPWGLLWTPWAIWVNTTGGCDCTNTVLSELDTPRTNAAHSSSQHAGTQPV